MTKLEELVAKLSELFELDKADLDFGIHRIIKAKHAQITTYLKERLPEKVKTVLGELLQVEAGESLAELKREILNALGGDAFQADGTLNPVYANIPLGKRYSAAVEAARNARSSAQTEAEVYSHLYEFFSRYYEEGDFISRRRRTAGRETYAIPYDGEEVVLHWANKDQYYVKSSEDLKDYTFTVLLNPSGDKKGRVQFKLTRMDAVQNNNKASRIFQLDSEAEIEAGDESLVIPFHFAEGKSRKQDDELAWENSVLAALPLEWQARLAVQDSSYTGNGERNILQKHLRNYTKKNTNDYFIHKDLGGFLRRELDFYIKNEVMYLDDVDNRPADYLEKELHKIKAIRAVAHDLIAFLAQFEDFQKRLWLKKKFVVETNWCITLDRIPEALYPEIAANDAQRQEWVRLFAIDEFKATSGNLLDQATPGYSEPLTVEFLKANNKLVLDTAFFSAEFKARLLASIDDIDAQTDGLLVGSDNFQALNNLLNTYQDSISTIYADPPYNADATPILYKNGFRHSTWLALMSDRLALVKQLLHQGGTVCVTVDDYELHRLVSLMDSEFLVENRLGTVVIRNNPSGRSTVKGFSVNHEYGLFYARSGSPQIGRLPHSKEQRERYDETDSSGQKFEWENFRKSSAGSRRSDRPKQYFPIYYDSQANSVRIPRMLWDVQANSWAIEEEPGSSEIGIWPLDADNSERVWRYGVERTQRQLSNLLVKEMRGRLEVYAPKYFQEKGILPRTWWDKPDYSARDNGTRALVNFFGSEKSFDFPKAPEAVKDSLRISTLGSDGIALDPFAGSGTTGQAVIELNKEDDGNRKFILIEMGDYFDTVTKPRIQKVIYSKDWKDGKPTSRATGVSHCFKYLRLESYEDTLNNLALEDRSADLLGLPEHVQDDYLLRYSLDVESRASLLDLTRFENPFAYTLKIYNRATGEAEPRLIDLPETFNYLLGLRVRTMRRLDGFLVIEGENPVAETVLVIWRNVKEKDNVALEAFVTGALHINPAETKYAAIYINGDTTLEDPHGKILLTEQVFHELMFDVKDL